MSATQEVVFDGHTIRFDAPVQSDSKLLIREIGPKGAKRPATKDEVIGILRTRPELPDTLRSLIVYLFEHRVIRTFSLGASLGGTARVDITLADKNENGHHMGPSKRIELFTRHFEAATRHTLKVQWKDDLTTTRRGGTTSGWFGNFMEIVFDAASKPLSLAEYIIWSDLD